MIKRDKEIMKHVEEYGFITTSQAYLIWFSNVNYGYDVARKRLVHIEKQGYLLSHKQKDNVYAEKIYYFDAKYAIPKKSMILAMNIYAELIRIGCDMIYYKREEPWQKPKYRSDAYGVFRIEKKIYSVAIEIINTTRWTEHKKSLTMKYKDIYNSNEPLEKIRKITNLNKDFSPPKLVIVSEIGKTNVQIDDIKLICVDYSLRGLLQIIT